MPAAEPRDYYHYGRQDILAWVEAVVPFQGRALDVGCAAGLMGEALLHLGFDEVWGVEPSAEVAREAQQRLSRVITDSFPNEEVANGAPFSAVFMMDALEHMADPWQALTCVRGLLSPEGVLVLSVPNVANYSIVYDLIRGRWEYSAAGLLDRGHLRFFTPRSLKLTLESEGFSIVASRDSLSRPLGRLYPLVRTAAALMPHMLVYQMIRVARPGGPVTKTSRTPGSA